MLDVCSLFCIAMHMNVKASSYDISFFDIYKVLNESLWVVAVGAM
jgi:hypothetical protein